MTAPEDLGVAATQTSTLCKRCNIAPATQRTRQDPVCENCFIQYITTKAIKRLELQKPRGSSSQTARKLLLPISFGPSSTSLLYLADKKFRGQFERMGRTFYELHIVHVDLNYWEKDRSNEIVERMEKIKALFPKHTYSIIGIEESLNIPEIDWSSLGLPDQISSPKADAKILKSRFGNLVDSLPSPTSRSDVIYTLLNRLLLFHASTQKCTSIIFGDSTTRLAERTLTSTASGRGFSLPWLVSDGPSPIPPYPNSQNTSPTSASNLQSPNPDPQSINVAYPLRDILKRELIAFTHLHPTLTPLITYDPSYRNISASDKATTINELMIQYFESVEENYPSIVANVVRTGSKLVAGVGVGDRDIEDRNEGGFEDSDGIGLGMETKTCGLCGLPVPEGTDGIFGWGGDQNDDDVSVRRGVGEGDRGGGRGILCYGCSRSVNG